MKKNKYTDLSMIKDVTTLQELAKHDNQIRNFAKEKIKNTDISNDIVNDMYLKLHEAMQKGKSINGGYIVMTIQNLYTNHINFEKRYQQEVGFQHDTEDHSQAVIKDKIEMEYEYTKLEKLLDDKLKWFEKKILELTQEMTVVELAEKSKIPYSSLIYTKNKIEKKLGIKK